jgi:hypothetical protein
MTKLNAFCAQTFFIKASAAPHRRCFGGSAPVALAEILLPDFAQQQPDDSVRYVRVWTVPQAADVPAGRVLVLIRGALAHHELALAQQPKTKRATEEESSSNVPRAKLLCMPASRTDRRASRGGQPGGRWPRFCCRISASNFKDACERRQLAARN